MGASSQSLGMASWIFAKGLLALHEPAASLEVLMSRRAVSGEVLSQCRPFGRNTLVEFPRDNERKGRVNRLMQPDRGLGATRNVARSRADARNFDATDAVPIT
jgi:hypothetical protein